MIHSPLLLPTGPVALCDQTTPIGDKLGRVKVPTYAQITCSTCQRMLREMHDAAERFNAGRRNFGRN